MIEDIVDIFIAVGFKTTGPPEHYILPLKLEYIVPLDSTYEEAGDKWYYTITSITDEFITVESSGVTNHLKKYGYKNMDYTLNISNGLYSVWDMLSRRDIFKAKIRDIKIDKILK